MSLEFIPGYLGQLTIDSDDYSIVGNVMALNATKNTPRKPVFGAQAQNVVSGSIAFSLSASGHVATANPIADLDAALRSDTPLAAVLTIGDPAIDGGSYAGNVVISAMSISADSEGEWDWSLDAEFDGDAAYTPPTP